MTIWPLIVMLLRQRPVNGVGASSGALEPVKHEVPDRRQLIITSLRERKEPNAKPAGAGERGLELWI